MNCKPAHLRVGARGEELTAEFLERKGYAVIDRNVRYPYGEIDLVARQGELIVLVEVKTRSALNAEPAEAVTFRKRERLLKAAETYLKKWPDNSARFDVVEVILPKNGGSRINHIEDAFDGREF